MPRSITRTASELVRASTDDHAIPRAPAELAEEVASVLAAMSYEERIRAYRGGIFTPRELSIAAARLPEEMPTLNGELEWIAWNCE